ncbi:hypothetical protein D9758_007598 [Tetrapyrgos nigripes]|uniref:FAD-binding PCMH-type domain-containing protein n=1 Tax=Tetrapyrgos nigripes TaxID=182062 RepID=A0A8H5G7V4_9AGAR|nr:hypothetical protein D9758_007598 [Tetrapyrgos nigripes]
MYRSVLVFRVTTKEVNGKDAQLLDRLVFSILTTLSRPRRSLVVNVRGPADVQAAFAFAEQTGVRVIIKNSGHDSLGRSSGPNTLAIRTTTLKNLTYIPEFVPEGCNHVAPRPAAAVGAGVIFQESYPFAEAHNISLPGGACPTVSPGGGYTLGGGHGMMVNNYGLGADRALQFKIVTPTGEFLTANECQNTDLWFALRGGGGGTFGVVLETVQLALPRNPVQMIQIQDFDNTDENTRAYMKIVLEHTKEWALQGWGGFVQLNEFQYINAIISPEEAIEAMKPLTDWAQTVDATIIQKTHDSYVTYWQEFLFPVDNPTGLPFAVASRLIPADNFETDEKREELLNATLEAAAGHDAWFGFATTPFKYGANKNTSATPAWRNALWHAIVEDFWNFDTTSGQQQQILQNLSSSIDAYRKITPGSGAYLNEADINEPNFSESFWGSNYDRLVSIKDKYDPNHLLDCWRPRNANQAGLMEKESWGTPLELLWENICHCDSDIVRLHCRAMCPDIQKEWNEISSLRSGAKTTSIDGFTLSMPALIAVARYCIPTAISEDAGVKERVEASADFVVRMSEPGAKGSMYGVNTGVGASDRTALQRVILKNLTSGILPIETAGNDNYLSSHHDSSLLLPESWSRGAMLLRLNTLLRGHSGCRWIVIERLHALLANNIIPSPPLRQSISASGDLAPLGYIASALTDEVVVPVWSGKGTDRKRTTSIEARKAHGIESIIYGPKEALAIVNGTGPSCAVGALALHDANILALTAQLTTAMAIEALNGSPETYDPFIHDIARPHPGQIEVAVNGRHLLKGSTFARMHDESDPAQKLRQDRYGLRTAPQWIGPHLEELTSARATIEIEMNSTTDNPIIDLENERNLGGGNFQGTSIALVMEKVRIGLQHLGKLVHAQFVELTSPHMNRGLPPDLAAWEPSLDFGVKTMDVATAAYLSELSFLGNTVTNHVQNAEQHNQAVNSLALISARYTFHAIQVLYMLYSNLIWALCQALDLRAMISIFFKRLESEIKASFVNIGLSESAHAALTKHIYDQARVRFGETSQMDSSTRFTELLRPLVTDVLDFLAKEGEGVSSTKFDALEWRTTLASQLGKIYREVRSQYYENGSAEGMMGNTVHLYRYVRKDLGVPIRKGGDIDTEGVDVQLSRIYRAFERGGIIEPVLKCFKQ